MDHLWAAHDVHADGNLRWSAREFFVADDTSQETLILGHQGFLDYFTASFDGEQCLLDLQPNPQLPMAAPVG